MGCIFHKKLVFQKQPSKAFYKISILQITDNSQGVTWDSSKILKRFYDNNNEITREGAYSRSIAHDLNWKTKPFTGFLREPCQKFRVPFNESCRFRVGNVPKRSLYYRWVFGQLSEIFQNSVFPESLVNTCFGTAY